MRWWKGTDVTDREELDALVSGIGFVVEGRLAKKACGVLLQDFASSDQGHVSAVYVMDNDDKFVNPDERVRDDVHGITSFDLERLIELLLGESDRSVRRVDRQGVSYKAHAISDSGVNNW